MQKLKAIIRYLFFIIPSDFFYAMGTIIFDNREIIKTAYYLRRFRNKRNIKNKILCEYLESCYKLINKEK